MQSGCVGLQVVNMWRYVTFDGKLLYIKRINVCYFTIAIAVYSCASGTGLPPATFE